MALLSLLRGVEAASDRDFLQVSFSSKVWMVEFYSYTDNSESFLGETLSYYNCDFGSFCFIIYGCLLLWAFAAKLEFLLCFFYPDWLFAAFRSQVANLTSSCISWAEGFFTFSLDADLALGVADSSFLAELEFAGRFKVRGSMAWSSSPPSASGWLIIVLSLRLRLWALVFVACSSAKTRLRMSC